jgi:hypothetical protein
VVKVVKVDTSTPQSEWISLAEAAAAPLRAQHLPGDVGHLLSHHIMEFTFCEVSGDLGVPGGEGRGQPVAVPADAAGGNGPAFRQHPLVSLSFCAVLRYAVLAITPCVAVSMLC